MEWVPLSQENFHQKNVQKFEGNEIFYIQLRIKTIFKDKNNFSIFGGGDSALDWAIELSNYSNVTINS